ncbi:MAG: protein kinase [Sandaracinaceae bacterium]|nr:protein kinase [Sandaracinaceae bacterium]
MAPPAAGELLDERFELRAIAGRGGMGTVYRALDRASGAEVALKVMHEHAGLGRFAREARLLAELDHPAIVRLVASGHTADGTHYLAMEWLEGVTLFERLHDGGLSVEEALAMARRVAAGLSAAHERGVVHRDIKPSNVLLVGGAARDCRILDFGIAHARLDMPLTYAGVAIGTPGYMAPEQVRGATDVDARADIFSLGCVLYECLVGAPPFVGSDPYALLSKILLEGIPRVRERRPEIDEDLDALVAAMMAREPAARPPTLREVGVRLAQLTSSRLPAPSRYASAPTALSGDERHLVSVVLAVPRGGADVPPLDATFAPTALFGAGEPDVQAFRVIGGAYVACVRVAGGAVDQAVRAASHALRLREALPSAAIALATGPGVLDGQLASGEVLELAAALVRDAGDGDVRVDPITAGLLGSRFHTRADPGADRIWLTGAAEAAGAVRPLLGRRTPFVGRRRELAALEAAFDVCEDEPGAVPVVVLGEPGIGKTRLRLELEAYLAGRARILRVQADPASVGTPLGTIAALLGVATSERLASGADLEAALRAELGDASGESLVFLLDFLGVAVDDPRLRAARADASIMRDQLRRAFEEWLIAQAERRPIALVLDDLQWSDAASVSFIDSALRRADDRAVFVLACARPELRERFPGLWSARGVQEITLRPLGSRAGAELARSVLGALAPPDLERIVETSAGNPLYLEELIRAAAEGEVAGTSSTVLAMIHSRLDRLAASERRALQAGSVFGDPFWVGGVAHLLGGRVPVDELLHALDRLASEELVVASASSRYAGEAQYAFRHDLVRQAASEMLEPRDRALGHRLAAAWLRGVGETAPLVLARHLEAGERPGEAASFFCEAAEQAVARADLEGALVLVERATRCFARAGDRGSDERVRLHLVAAHAHNATGAISEGTREASAVVSRARPGSLLWWRGAGELVEALGRLGDRDGLLAIVERMREPAERDAELASVIAICRACIALHFQGRPEAVAALRDRLRGASVRVGAEPLAVAWRAALEAYQAHLDGRPSDYLLETVRSVEALAAAGDLRGRCRQLSNVGAAYVMLGRYDEARVAFHRARDEAARFGMRHVILHATLSLGFISLERGELGEATRQSREAAEGFAASGDARAGSYARSFLARSLSLEGRDEEAVAEARRAVREAENHAHMHGHCRAVLAEVLLWAGSAAEALEQAELAFEVRRGLGRLEVGDGRVDVAYAEALRANGQHERAAEVYAGARARLLEVAARIDDETSRASFLHVVGAHARIMAATDDPASASSRIDATRQGR